ncbi:Ig-like domain-containing protein [Nocardioides sp. SYSU D00065]|uniref:Ig-like domain-containing protein n=1 Tax=Nocardioides sp. SYSU D00065 TaxID=2817378 RepID=UPI001B33EFD6|nr:Ig-like domain-containing protein [Nocardioides sp. SYSU D00065]
MSATSRSLTTAGAVLLVLTSAGPVAAAPAAARAAAPSTTTVTLSTTASAYGQTVTASAAVTTVPGPPEGDVVFSVDGLAIKANLGGGGTASVVLPDATVGQHTVTATFVPQYPTSQQSSTSAPLTWQVAQVRTRLQVRVIGKGARIPTSVQVKADGEYGSRPTGPVEVVVKRAGSRARDSIVGQLDRSAVLRARFGRLPKGRYRAVVAYGGDAQHLPERQVARFVVRKR